MPLDYLTIVLAATWICWNTLIGVTEIHRLYRRARWARHCSRVIDGYGSPAEPSPAAEEPAAEPTPLGSRPLTSLS